MCTIISRVKKCYTQVCIAHTVFLTIIHRTVVGTFKDSLVIALLLAILIMKVGHITKHLEIYGFISIYEVTLSIRAVFGFFLVIFPCKFLQKNVLLAY